MSRRIQNGIISSLSCLWAGAIACKAAYIISSVIKDILVTRYNLITLVPIELEQKFRQILKALVKSINLKYSKGSKGSRKKAREPSSLFIDEPFEPLEARVNP